MIRIRQIKIKIEDDTPLNLEKSILKKIKSNEKIEKLIIQKKSIDARRKNEIYYVYEVDIEIKNQDKIIKRNKSKDVFIKPNEEFSIKKIGTKKMKNRPIIVGSGPAGLFCGYILAENGYNPIIIERGEKIEDRVKSVKKFWETGILNLNSNVQFGEGGAGTFSDGKLNTLVKDKQFIGKKVFEIFVDNGAKEEIMYKSNPHIGTDMLRNIIINIRKKMINMGAEFKYNTMLTNINIESGKLKSITINNKEEIKCDNLVLAIGHSARDTFKMLYDNNIRMNSKPFAVGIRIQHKQDMINKNQYGDKYNLLENANYKLTYKSSDGRGVYSFCMCPGGFVVNSSSEDGLLSINGMSNNSRDEENANSAIVVTVSDKDYGKNIFDGIKFQKELEKKAYDCCNGKIPVQLYSDFINNKKSTGFKDIKPIFKGEYDFYDLNKILPDFICKSLKESIEYFNEKIKGFSGDDVILSAVESRTSSPIRIERDENFMSNVKGIYPAGEGAGYAGGITTSAMDGIRIACKIISMYRSDNYE